MMPPITTVNALKFGLVEATRLLIFFDDCPLTIVISRTHLKRRINLSIIMPGLVAN
jgi:hypothetical protein